MSAPIAIAVCPHCREDIGVAPWEYRDLWEMLIASEVSGSRVTVDASVMRALLGHIEALKQGSTRGGYAKAEGLP